MLQNDERMNVSQAHVRRKDGVQFMCEDASDFNDTVTGPFWFGPDGSVALYVTHQRAVDEDNWQKVEGQIKDPEWGDLVTILPADQISMIELRCK